MAQMSVPLEFQNVKTRRLSEEFGDVTFVVAEVEEPLRQHRRILAATASDSSLNGKAIVYADVYPRRQDVTYAYARHRWDAASFLDDLDSFLRAEFPTWMGRRFPVVLNVNGSRVALEASGAFRLTLPDPKSISFMKFTFPFGPITIEFGGHRVVENNFDQLKKGRLVRALETPLVGCDVTNTELVTTLIARGHWASSKIPMDILNSLLLQAAPAFA